MKKVGLPLFVKPPDSFIPGRLALNFLIARAALEQWIDWRLRSSLTWSRKLYPPPWHKAYGGANNTIFSAAKYWAIVLPLLVGFTSALPLKLQTSGFEFVIEGDLEFSLLFQLSFLSALFFIAALIIRSMLAPAFIAEYPKKFAEIPGAMTNDELHQSYHQFCTGGMPKLIGWNEFRFEKRASGTYFIGFYLKYKDEEGNAMSLPGGNAWGVFSYLCWRCSSPAQWDAIRRSKDFFAYEPNFFNGDKPLMDRELLHRLAQTGSFITDIDEMGLKKLIEHFVYPKEFITTLFPIIFGWTSLIEGREVACYQPLYNLWDYSAPLARSVFWFCYSIAFVLGIIVTGKLLLRGFAVLF